MSHETLIHPERVQALNGKPLKAKGDYVLYWMQQSQRTVDNHALEMAQSLANDRQKPLLVFFGLTDAYPGATRRAYHFMMQGLQDIQSALNQRGAGFVFGHISPEQGALELSRHAICVVTDKGYTRIQRAWREHLAVQAPVQVLQVETDAVVPVGAASDKDRFGAYALRPSLHRLLPDFLKPIPAVDARQDGSTLSIETSFDQIQHQSPESWLAGLTLRKDVPPVAGVTGGQHEALRRLDHFLEQGLSRYDTDRNDPNAEGQSGLSPYLHFGQLSPLTAALAARATGLSGVDAFLEELIVRRELSFNFCQFNPQYDSPQGLPDWAIKTLTEHENDPRKESYTPEQWEQAETHDPYWNAAQKQLRIRGGIHGYMRMYWGKKLLEWSADWRQAFTVALDLNDTYALDGRDPNGFAGVAWCFGKHDRPWKERAVFGKIRYMNDKGLRRKFDADAYVQRMEALWHTESSKTSPPG